MKKLAALFAFSAVPAWALFAASASDISSYQSGGSMAWYHELIADARSPETKASAEKTVMEALASGDISDEAFRLSCKILKASASDECVRSLVRFAENPARAPSVFDVLVSHPTPAADAALIGIVEKSKDENALAHAAYALGSRASRKAVAPLLALAEKSSGRVLDACVVALGHIPGRDSAAAVAKIAKSGKADPFLVSTALAELRASFIASGDTDGALSISLSPDFRPGLLSLARMKGAGAMPVLDGIIVSEGPNARYAARIANSGRTFENSGKLLKSFDGLSEGAKVAAVRSFALSGDKRFFPAIKGLIDGSDSPVAIEAIYACEFIGTDAAVRPLIEILESKNDKGKRPKASHAAGYVLQMMPSEAVNKALKSEYSKTKSPLLLNVLIERANLEYRGELIKRLLDSSDPDLREITSLAERQLGYGGLEPLFKAMQKSDDKARSRAFRTAVKFVASDRDKKFRKGVVEKYFGAAKMTDEERQLVETRLLNPPKAKK